MNEKVMQGVLMQWLMSEKGAQIVVPNLTVAFNWECDLYATVTSGFVHEIEIKCTVPDYKADFRKRKHAVFKSIRSKKEKAGYPARGNYPAYRHAPNYFWFATWKFEVEPPKHAGWILVKESGKVIVKRNAPRLHSLKVTERMKQTAARCLSWRVANMYSQVHGLK